VDFLVKSNLFSTIFDDGRSPPIVNNICSFKTSGEFNIKNMTKKIKLNWRLKSLPTVDELQKLVDCKLITQEEAREILFTKEEYEERDSKSLKEEIKFLRELIEKLSNNRNDTITYIEAVSKPYYKYGWYGAYDTWCSGTVNNTIGNDSMNISGSGSTGCLITTPNGDVNLITSSIDITAFNAIKTF